MEKNSKGTKTLWLLVGLLLVALGAYLMFSRQAAAPGAPTPEEPATTATYSSPAFGIEFSYPAGYVLTEPGAATGDLLHTVMLMREEDAAQTPPVGGEGPPVITLQIFKNSQKQWSGQWAEAHHQESNINLKQGEVAEAVVGGANAARYRIDGLYLAEVVVVASGEHVYVVTGQYLDEDSALRKDFGPIIDSVRFVPQPRQV